MSRKPLIAGNWKMNKTPAESVVLSQGISNRYSRKWNKVDVVLCPPTIDLRSVFTVLDFDKSNIDVGAQNCHWEPSGAFTGETSIPMLKDVGAAWCIVGHSERRDYFGETDSKVNKKVRALAESSFNAIVCVGESLAVRDAGDAVRFVCDQVRAALAGLDAHEAVLHHRLQTFGLLARAARRLPVTGRNCCGNSRYRCRFGRRAGHEYARALQWLYEARKRRHFAWCPVSIVALLAARR